MGTFASFSKHLIGSVESRWITEARAVDSFVSSIRFWRDFNNWNRLLQGRSDSLICFNASRKTGKFLESHFLNLSKGDHKRESTCSLVISVRWSCRSRCKMQSDRKECHSFHGSQTISFSLHSQHSIYHLRVLLQQVLVERQSQIFLQHNMPSPNCE